MFKDRQEAGDKLVKRFRKIINPSIGSERREFAVIALLRGGMILGKKISDYFKIPLFPLSVKKIGAPLNPELAIGAIAFDKTYYFNKYLIKCLSVDESYLERSSETKSKEAQILQGKFLSPLKFPPSQMLRRTSRRASKISLKDKKVIVVDDGIATGTTAICASIYLKKQKAKKIILAVPVMSGETLKSIKGYFDNVISLKITDQLASVSQFYKYFPQITDEEAMSYLV